MVSGRDIPDGIKREVRQRCGYGCVICGVPVYQYDHLVGWAQTRRHVADEITLLCGLHHDMKTRGQLSEKTVYKWNSSPFNRQAGVTAPFGLDFSSSGPGMIKLAGNYFSSVDNFAAVMIDDVVTLGFRRIDGELALTLVLHNQYNEPELLIQDNVLQMSAGVWDIEYQGQTLTIRSGPRQVSLCARFTPPSTVDVLRAVIALNGVTIEATPQGISFAHDRTAQMFGNYFDGPIGIKAGHCPAHAHLPSASSFPRIDRYNGSMPVTPPSGAAQSSGLSTSGIDDSSPTPT